MIAIIKLQLIKRPPSCIMILGPGFCNFLERFWNAWQANLPWNAEIMKILLSRVFCSKSIAPSYWGHSLDYNISLSVIHRNPTPLPFVLLAGNEGCGKSLIIQQIARLFQSNFIEVRISFLETKTKHHLALGCNKVKYYCRFWFFHAVSDQRVGCHSLVWHKGILL